MPDWTAPVQLSAWDVFLRMLCAMAVGTAIGIEREYSKRPAGMRTHILVALGACAVMLTGEMIFTQYHAYGAAPDPARLAAQVITGVGFLGAGTILREGVNVRGLTTAASLWAVACLGVACGAGFYSIALVGTVFIFITLTLMEILQNRMIVHDASLVCFRLETGNITDGLNALNHHARQQNAGIQELRIVHREDGCYEAVFCVDIGGLRAKKRRQLFLEGLAKEPSITAVFLSREEKSNIH